MGCKESFHSFDKKREHYYGVHASKSTETSQEENITAGTDNDIGISCASQNAQSPVVVRTVEELMTEADSEPNQEPDIDTTTEDVSCLELGCDILFSNKSNMLEHYRRHHVKMSDEEDS